MERFRIFNVSCDNETMRFIIFFTCFFVSCNSLSNQEHKVINAQPEEVSSLPAKSTRGQKFFHFDEVEHYYTDYNGSISELIEDANSPGADTMKASTLLDKLPKELPKLDFLNKLPEIGYKKVVLNKSTNPIIDTLFTERFGAESEATNCLQIYRDLLIFRYAKKIVGIAKICFSCRGSSISGTEAYTDEFGWEGDYSKLKKILNR